MTIGRRFQRAAAEGYDEAGLLKRGGERFGLHGAEGRLAAFGEDARHGAAIALLDDAVEIDEAPAEALGARLRPIVLLPEPMNPVSTMRSTAACAGAGDVVSNALWGAVEGMRV